MAVELEQEAEKAVGEVLQAWAAPCVELVAGLIAKARSGLSDADFRAEVKAVLSGLAEMALTDDDALVEALWDAGAQAYRAGWEANGDDVAGSKRKCHKPAGTPCREHGWSAMRLFESEEVTVLKGGRKILFDYKLRKHFKDNDKNRKERLRDLEWAKEAVRSGKHRECYVMSMSREKNRLVREKRLIYELAFEENDKPYTMKVVCILVQKKRWQVLTYHRQG